MKEQNIKLEEFEKYIENKKVAIIGLGVSNIPLIDYLHNNNAQVSIFDERNLAQIKEKVNKEILENIEKYNFTFITGKKCLEYLKNFDIIFRSPSCLPTRKELVKEQEKGTIITTEIEMLIKLAPCKIIGITGSDGKTTTTSLIYEILSKSGRNTYLGGNIGLPLFTKLNEIKKDDIIVLELSSFQLMGMDISPDIAVITNISPNHLNIHKDYEEYIQSKKNIFKYQDESGIVVLNYDNDITRNMKKEANGKVIYFSGTQKLEDGYILDDNIIKKCDDGVRKHILDCKEVLLRGKHNYENIETALATTESLVSIEKAIQYVKNFKAVEHRLEYIRELDGVKWYNDSVSSSPTRAIAGLKSFEEEIVLIAGGYDKNLDYTPIAKPIVDKVKVLILIGQTSKKIEECVKLECIKQNRKIEIYKCELLEDTVKIAKQKSKPNQVVLFSPASASFDMFKDFADRGIKFKELVNKI